MWAPEAGPHLQTHITQPRRAENDNTENNLHTQIEAHLCLKVKLGTHKLQNYPLRDRGANINFVEQTI